VLDVLLGGPLSVLCYPAAVVLLTAALAASNVIAVRSRWLVLGANLGGGLVAVVTTLNADPITRRVPVEICSPGDQCALALAVLPTAYPGLLLGSDPQRLILNFHLAFNVLLAAIFLPFVAPLGRVVDSLVPAKPIAELPGLPRHLDRSLLRRRRWRSANAARESIRLGRRGAGKW